MKAVSRSELGPVHHLHRLEQRCRAQGHLLGIGPLLGAVAAPPLEGMNSIPIGPSRAR